MKAVLGVLILSAAASPLSAHAGCNDGAFETFFAKFSSSAEFSKERTIWPLTISTLERGESPVRTISQAKSPKDYWGTEMPISEFLKRNPNVRTYIAKDSKSKVTVNFGIEDADAVFDFEFAKKDGCWRLVKVYDWD